MGRRQEVQIGRRHDVAQHARDQLADRYQIALTPEAWDELAREIEDWPYTVSDRAVNGEEGRIAQVKLAGPCGIRLIIPFVYVAGPDRVRIVTVHPGGIRVAGIDPP